MFHNDMIRQPTLVLFCGLPGSGKTTTAHQLEHNMDAVRLCTDEWLADLGLSLHDEAVRGKLQARLYELGKTLIQLKQDVILEDGLWRREERDEKRYDARKLGARTEMHYFNVPFEELWRRVEKRNKSGGRGTVSITKEQLKSYWNIFERPNNRELALFDTYVVHS